jgi:PAS domain S-box-containing protein
VPAITERDNTGVQGSAGAEQFSGSALRSQAESLLQGRADSSGSSRDQASPQAIEQTLYELRVHQIELEMQNEELQRRQVELYEANRRYFDLYDLAPLGYFTLSEADLILQTNLTASNLLGYERSALVKQTFSRLITAEDMDRYYLLCRALLKTGQAQSAELRMKKQDGTLLWAHLQTNLSQEADGTRQLRLVLSDISERKRAEAAQAKSDAQFRDLFNAIDQGFCMVELLADANGDPLDYRFTEVNPSFAKLTGLVDAKGKTLRAFDSQDGMPLLEVYRQVAQTGQAMRFETQSAHLDRWFEVYAFRFDKTHAMQLALLLSDITERKARESVLERNRLELEEQVARRTRQFLDLYDQAPCGYHSLSQDGVVLEVNKTELALLGYSRDEYVGHRIAEFMAPASVPLFNEANARFLESGKLRNFEADFFCKDGSIRSFSIDADLVVDASSETPLSRSTMVDITERKHNAQRLELALMGADLGLWDVQICSGAMHLSARVCAMLGYPEGGIGTHTSDFDKLVHPDDLPLRRAAIHAIYDGDLPSYVLEHRLRHSDGHWVWVRSRGKVVARDENAAPLRATGTLQDISQEKQLKLVGADLLQRIESLIQGKGKAPEAAPALPQPSPTSALGAREQQVIQLIAAGCTSAEIGEHLGISTSTAATHRRNLMRKLDLHSAAELTRYALAHKLISN